MNVEDKEPINEIVHALIVAISKGNVGVVNVLCQIVRKDPMFLNPLGIAMELTESPSFGIWLVYKDICKFDVEKTMQTLREWFENSIVPLDKWCESKGVR